MTGARVTARNPSGLKRGELYASRHWLDPRFMPLHVPAVMLVTRVTKGAIYLRPHYGFHAEDERGARWPWLGSALWIVNSPEAVEKSLAHRMEMDANGDFRLPSLSSGEVRK